MIKAEQESIIKRIQKVFKLAENAGSLEEAQTAMEMAHAMLEKYNITLQDVKDFPEDDIFEEGVILTGKSLSAHISILTGAIMHLYDCRAIFSREEKGSILTFVGIGVDPVLASQTFEFLLSFAKRKMREYRFRYSTEKNDYLYGFSRKIQQRAYEMKPEVEEKGNTSAGNELVLVKRGVVDKYIENKNLGKSRKPRSRRFSAEMRAGIDDGASVNLNGQLERKKGNFALCA